MKEREPNRCTLCREDEDNASYYVETARQMGHKPYLVRDRLRPALRYWVVDVVDTFRDGAIYRSELQYQRLPSGTYIIRDGNVMRVNERF